MRTLLIWLLLISTCLAGWQPVDYQKWKATENDTTFRLQFGGALANYNNGSGWAAIDNNWQEIGDTLSVHTAVLQTDILPDATVRITLLYGGNTYTLEQRLVKLIWLKLSNWNWTDVADNPSWDSRSYDSTIVTWTGVFPAVDYRVQKRNGSVEHSIFFKPGFLDSAVTLYNQREDSLDLALANVIEYTFSANIDDTTGNIDGRILKDFGKHLFKIANAHLHFPGDDEVRESWRQVHHRWVKQSGKIYCVEYIEMSKLKQIHEELPSATIWHNDTETIEGTTNVEDAYVNELQTDYNYGGSEQLRVAVYLSNEYWGLVRCKNLSTVLGGGVTISACTLAAYNYYNYADDNVYVHRIFKPWVEGDEDGVDDDDGDVTFNDWASDTYEWSVAGLGCENDAGSDNNEDNKACNATRADATATPMDTVYVETINTWYYFRIDATLAQDWYDGDANEEGVVLKDGGAGYNRFYTTEASSNQLYWLLYYSGAAAPTGQVIIIGDATADSAYTESRKLLCID